MQQCTCTCLSDCLTQFVMCCNNLNLLDLLWDTRAVTHVRHQSLVITRHPSRAVKAVQHPVLPCVPLLRLKVWCSFLACRPSAMQCRPTVRCWRPMVPTQQQVPHLFYASRSPVFQPPFQHLMVWSRLLNPHHGPHSSLGYTATT